jgi:hypothetical protein
MDSYSFTAEAQTGGGIFELVTDAAAQGEIITQGLT